MLSSSGDMPRMGSQISANSYNFDVVKEFIYLDTAIHTNDVSLEIKRRVTLHLISRLASLIVLMALPSC